MVLPFPVFAGLSLPSQENPILAHPDPAGGDSKLSCAHSDLLQKREIGGYCKFCIAATTFSAESIAKAEGDTPVGRFGLHGNYSTLDLCQL